MEVRYSSRLLCIEYFADLVPPDGEEVRMSVATFQKSHGKDPAGHSFHEFARKQSGVLGMLLLLDAVITAVHAVALAVVGRRHAIRAQGAYLIICFIGVGSKM